LLAGPRLLDPNFFRAVVLVLEHGDDGALGVVLNRPSELTVHDALPEWSANVSEPEVVFVGGPVSPGTALALGRGPQADAVVGDVGIVDLDTLAGTWRDVRVFSGYSGWGPGQLESELVDDAWFVLEARADDVCSAAPDELWSAVLSRQPGPLSRLARYPDEPAFN
jgi:putative transcriptional regulator